jgi:phosphoserine phosphatase
MLFWLLCWSAFFSRPDRRLRESAAEEPLASWNEVASKHAILEFVKRVASEGSPDFVPVAERIAVFDNDGTLWSEQPVYFQLAFALDRVKALAPKHPEWKTTQPFKGVLEGDMKAALAGGERSLMAIIAATHAGMTTDEFSAAVTDWLKTSQHPRFKRPYSDLIFQPMLEVLDYLRANGFKTYIVSGGGAEMIRAFAERVYGIPPEHVIGSRIKMEYQERGGHPVIARLPGIEFIDDKAGKPVGIEQVIGRRPIMAFGNSDGDFQMLEWTPRARARDSRSSSTTRTRIANGPTTGRRASDSWSGPGRRPKRGWIIADMKADWKVIYPFQN